MPLVLFCNGCDRFIRGDLPVITYPTPPYLLLREIMGPRAKTLIVRRWLDRGMGGGYQSVQMRPSVQTQGTQRLQITSSEQESYAQNSIEVASIQDRRNKVLQYDTASGKLFAKPLEGENVKYRAIFEIISYFPKRTPSRKIATAFKIRNTNLYLSISPQGELIAQENPKLARKKFDMDDITKQFFFFREGEERNYTTFESDMYPEEYIGTTEGDDTVTVTNDNRGIREFLVIDEGQKTSKKMSDAASTRTSTNTSTTSMLYPYDRFCMQVSENRNHAGLVYPYLGHSPYLGPSPYLYGTRYGGSPKCQTFSKQTYFRMPPFGVCMQTMQ